MRLGKGSWTCCRDLTKRMDIHGLQTHSYWSSSRIEVLQWAHEQGNSWDTFTCLHEVHGGSAIGYAACVPIVPLSSLRPPQCA